jgi:hypothetical protein
MPQWFDHMITVRLSPVLIYLLALVAVPGAMFLAASASSTA